MAKYAVFKGRASRSEFWWFVVVAVVLWIVATLIDGDVQRGARYRPGMFATIVIAIHLLPWFGVGVRRLHDMDKAGPFFLLNGFAPLGSIAFLIWACFRGTSGPNRFGPDPLQAVTGAGPQPQKQPVAAGVRAVSTVAPQPAYDMIGEIERLSTLRAAGGLSEAEFEVLKAQAIGRARS